MSAGSDAEFIRVSGESGKSSDFQKGDLIEARKHDLILAS
jgi:hypothetical protein